MDLLLVALIALIIMALFGAKAKGRRRFKYNPEEEWPFTAKKLQTNNEEALYKRLKEMLPEYHIFAQVQLSRLIDVKKGHDFNKWFNRINRMSVDFVICDESLKVISVIELDDSSHRDQHRQEQDYKKNKALKSADINIIRWQKIPSNEEIISQIKSDRKIPLAA